MAQRLLKPEEPETEEELTRRACELSGKSLQQLAHAQAATVPANLTHDKGWIGELLEYELGASAASRPEPDFRLIGVELKTIPIDKTGAPKESTYVCRVNLTPSSGGNWESSLVRKKLNRVLWVPIEADPDIPIHLRRVGMPFIWSPSNSDEQILKTDWQEAMDLIGLGEIDKLHSTQGTFFQVRPKAANSRVLTTTSSENGELTQSLPRGFYLRPVFTKQILQGNL